MAIPVSMGFVLSDLGLIFLNSSQFHLTQGMGTLISLLGALTFVESLLSLNVIDMLLPYSGNPTVYPIAPISTCCFLLIGIACLGLTHHRIRTRATVISGILGTVILL